MFRFADCKDTNNFSILKKTKNKVFNEIEIITNWNLNSMKKGHLVMRLPFVFLNAMRAES